MSSGSSYVIVGASLAGAKAAEGLRAEGFDGRVVLIGDERERPYERPGLSKGYLLGKDERAKSFVHDESWYSEHNVELVLGDRVTGLDRAAHEVTFDSGERIGYTKLLLATGVSPRRLKVDGVKLDGIHYLRRIGQSDKLRDAIRAGGRVVVVGAGWIGLETAAAAREYGCDVTVIEPQETPLAAALGGEMGAFFASLHLRHGVDLRLGQSVSGFRGTDKVEAVLTEDGSEYAADVVVIGIGARPNTELAEQAGLSVDNGIVVDAAFRTDDADVYAVGDVANIQNPLYGERLRVEHWDNALNGGPAAAKSMLGQDVSYDHLPYFFTDQYDVGMEFSGWIGGGYDQLVTRGDVEKQAFHAFWLADRRVVAGMHINQWDDGIAPTQDLIRSQRQVDPSRLGDPSTPLTEA
ncbi:NAD(P)/FAD-dependent oxidoreductase [Kribbella sp. DT2]|uniref:NAD(P)/FAD-dependent oxidoreductase n=1 Tax=Kribbella sp. DT2 TaxID=3393427 RepID=UPI003CF867AF